jgi:PAS domain S-box-containing protein
LEKRCAVNEELPRDQQGTATNRAEGTSRQSAKRFRHLANAMPGVVWTAAPDGTITYTNDRWYAYTGLTPQQNAVDWARLALHPDDYDRCMDQWSRALREGKDYEIEVRNRRHDGEYRWWLTRATPVKDRNGRVIAWYGVSTDIHEKKLIEEELRYKTQLLNTITDNAPSMLYMIDAEDRATFVNPAVEQITGYKAEELIGQVMHEKVHHSRPDRTPFPIDECPLSRASSLGGAIRDHKDVFVRKDGTFFPVQCSARPIFRDGVAIGTVIEARDITHRKKTEEAQTLLAAIVESSDDAIVSKTLEGIITSWNRGAERLFGYTAREAEGRPITIIIPPERHDEEQSILQRISRGERIEHFETVRVAKTGRVIHVSLTISPIFDSTGRIIGASKVARDITERKRAEEALKEADRRKDEFLANMSHEIRSPMTSVMGYADILLARLVDPDNIECVKIIKQSGNYLLELINDILDLSKIESGKLVIKKERVFLPNLFNELHSLMSLRAKEKGLSMVLRYEGGMPESIESDRTRLRQILINLLSNAVKFTEKGGIEIVASFRSEESILQIDVTDTGIGISRAQEERLFQPFTQADSSARREYGGTGLGLAITKRLVDMLGGKIYFESRVNEGTTFHVVLPTGPVRAMILTGATAESATAALVPDSQLNCRVLVADDRREIQYLVRLFIEEAGGWVMTVGDGQAAIEAIREGEKGGQPVDVVVMDMQMPGLDGYEATRRLRAQGFAKPIIALTAGAMMGERGKCLAAGCDAYLSKPIDRRTLIRLVSYCADASAQRSFGTDSGSQPEKPTRKILLVDDSEIACRSTARLLEMSGHEVRMAFDGQSALARIANFDPQVVILDIRLPDISGYELLRQLKERENLRDAKFIALTGYGEEFQRTDLEVDFNHFLTKPVDPGYLETLILSGPT